MAMDTDTDWRTLPPDCWPAEERQRFYAAIGCEPRFASRELNQSRLDWWAWLYVTGLLATDDPK